MRRCVWALLAIGLILADRLTKLWAARTLSLGVPHPLIGDAIRLTRVHNEGGAFGFLPGNGSVFVAVSAAAAVFILVVLLFYRHSTPLLRFGLSLVLVGAVGNLIDRVAYGYVLDFFEVRGFPVFNVADSCITGGAGLIMVFALLGGDRLRSLQKADRV
jgi:signal peptidase II